MKKVGVMGLGLMGSGIAEVSMLAGYATTVGEVDQALLQKGRSNIERSLARAVERGKMTGEQRDHALALLRPTTDLALFQDCDIVIEAVTENLAAKENVFRALDKACKKEALLASNTSSLSVTQLASCTQRPDRVIGTHFFNPVPVMKLVEVVRGIASSEDSVAQAKSFCESLGKVVVLAKDTPGFVVNRLLVPYLLDAIREYERGLASAEDIDNGMVLGCNHPMGPLRLTDLVGLDTTYFIALSLYEEFGEPRFEPPPILKRMVLAGWLGRKRGRGFYQYSDGNSQK